MSTEWLIETVTIPEWATDPVFGEELRRDIARAGMNGAKHVWTIISDDDPTLWSEVLDGTVIGAWDDETGRFVVQPTAEFLTIRPLGNNPDGSATSDLLFIDWSGWPQRTLASEVVGEETVYLQYPKENDPFRIELRHKWFGGNADPAHDGYGWRAEIIDPGYSRLPGPRAIGIYTDAECLEYWYTTGAFSLQASEFGQAGQVWATEYNPAFLTGVGEPAPFDVHHAVLLGAAQEGHQTLLAGKTSTTHLYWKTNQAPPPAGEEWVDTGATVTGQAGQLYYISDPAVVATLLADQAIKLGDQETTFVQIWPGTDDLIEINPYVSASPGDKLWAWQ